MGQRRNDPCDPQDHAASPTQIEALSPQADTVRPAVFNPNERMFRAAFRSRSNTQPHLHL